MWVHYLTLLVGFSGETSAYSLTLPHTRFRFHPNAGHPRRDRESRWGAWSFRELRGPLPLACAPWKDITEGGKPWGLQSADDKGTFKRTADGPCHLSGSLDTWGRSGSWGNEATAPSGGVQKLHHRCQFFMPSSLYFRKIYLFIVY